MRASGLLIYQLIPIGIRQVVLPYSPIYFLGLHQIVNLSEARDCDPIEIMLFLH